MPETSNAAVLVAHPSALLAAGLASALSPTARVASASRLAQALAEHAPWLVITDHQQGLALLQGRPGRRGADAPGWRCLVVDAQVGACQVQQALACGVQGYVQADCSIEVLQHAVRALQAGQRFLCSAAAARMAEGLAHERLTPRETEVLALLAEGLDNKSIALRLDLSLGTVKSHVKAILDKLGARSRTHAVMAAQHRGLLGEPAQTLRARHH